VRHGTAACHQSLAAADKKFRHVEKIWKASFQSLNHVLNSFGRGAPRSPLTGHLTGSPAVNYSHANNIMQTYLVTSVSGRFAAAIPVPPARIGGRCREDAIQRLGACLH
jgi:hypothetical protein